MTIGQKVKKTREANGLTQLDIAGGKITRNMLSAIESGKAYPSFETLKFIAARLGVSPSYLISDDDDLFFYEKKDKIDEIKQLLKNKKYKNCIEKIEQIYVQDDELDLILAHCYFGLAKKHILNGSLKTGKELLKFAEEHSKKTAYDTSKIENASLIYSSLIKNMQAPLLELETEAFEKNIGDEFEYDFYKYLIADVSYKQRNTVFADHLKAKQLIKARRYQEALSLLSIIEAKKTPESYNAYVVFSLYSDMENCYKQLSDFENAYRYASKKLSLIEGFKL